MTIREVIARLEAGGLVDDSRKAPLLGVIVLLTELSKAELRSFETFWDRSRPFEEFTKAQNQIILKCLRLELSEIGAGVRKALGLDPLTEDTEV